MMLAALILAAHLGIIAFNLLGLVVIPLGAWRGWRFVRVPLWRMLHVASLAVVALQAIAGRACFLTIWQDELAGGAPGHTPLIMRWINSVLFWPLPLWVFGIAYVAVFAFVVLLLWWVPPNWRR